MIGQTYKVAIGSQAQTAAKTLIEVAAPSDAVVTLEKIHIGQTSFDTAENLGMKVEDITTTGTGTAITPRPTMEGASAFGGVVETNSSVEPTYSGTVFEEEGFNVLSGLKWSAVNDEDIIAISPSQLIGVMLDVAPSASMNFSYGCTIREIGG